MSRYTKTVDGSLVPTPRLGEIVHLASCIYPPGHDGPCVPPEWWIGTDDDAPVDP